MVRRSLIPLLDAAALVAGSPTPAHAHATFRIAG